VKRTAPSPSSLGAFSSGVSLGGKVLRYRVKENIYSQGTPAPTLFYIQEGGVRLTVRSKIRSSAVTSILGPNDFFGELCLMGYPLRRSTAEALTDCVILAIPKGKMMTLLRENINASNDLVGSLLSKMKNDQEHVADLLTCSAEQRLALVLLRLARLDADGPTLVEIPVLSHQVLAEMIGTTRSRVNFFMNRFRKQRLINYDGGLEIHRTLHKVLGKR
jgi:CRP/FNR family cyclic AMP-dependent transcriptional regulator